MATPPLLPLLIFVATYIGSALTPIGNPQNILISQKMGLAFGPFVAHCVLPVVLSLAALYLFLLRSVPRMMPAAGPRIRREDAQPFLPGQAAKAIVLTVAAIALFLTPVPAGLTAMAAARLLTTWGANLALPTVSIPVVAVLGNLVGNVPAVMLLLPLTPPEPVAAPGNGEIAVGWLCVSTFIRVWVRPAMYS